MSFFKRGNFFVENKGFTMVEIMLVVALVILIGGISAPVYQSFQVRNDLDVMADVVSQTLRRAQIASQASDGDSDWGVNISSGSVILYKGSSFSGRDSNFDEVFEISDTISISGLQDIVYSKFSGEPQSTGDINLTSLAGETRVISINEKGMVGY